MEKKNKILWYIVAIGVLLLFFLILISSILSLGERLTLIHPYVSYGFYGLCIILVYFLIINPIRIIVFSPAFNIETVLDKPSRKRYKTYKIVAKNLIKNNDISAREKAQLKNHQSKQELQATLNHIYNSTLKKKINKLIFNHAKTVFISTAISQNGRMDLIASFVVNLRLIKEIVKTCGFRPSFKNLSKLTINVFSTALIAEGLENIEFSELLPANAQSFIKNIPFGKVVTESLVQGTSNAILTLRVGIITRKYLFSDAKELSKKEIRRGAFIETIKIVPLLIKDSFESIPDKIKGIFKKEPKEAQQA